MSVKVTISGPTKSGKTHVMMLVEKALREAGVNATFEDEGNDHAGPITMRRVALGLDTIQDLNTFDFQLVDGIRKGLADVSRNTKVEVRTVCTNRLANQTPVDGGKLCMTYAGLKELVDGMTPEQLQMPVAIQGEGLHVLHYWTADQDQINPSGDGMEGVDDYRRHLIEEEGETPEEADKIIGEESVVAQKGQTFLATEE